MWIVIVVIQIIDIEVKGISFFENMVDIQIAHQIRPMVQFFIIKSDVRRIEPTLFHMRSIVSIHFPLIVETGHQCAKGCLFANSPLGTYPRQMNGGRTISF